MLFLIIILKCDLSNKEVIKGYIKKIRKAKNMIILFASGELEDCDETSIPVLKDLHHLEMDLINLKKVIQNIEKVNLKNSLLIKNGLECNKKQVN